jgi:hypothetical protein
VLDGSAIHTSETRDDATGGLAYENAVQWAEQFGHTIRGWKQQAGTDAVVFMPVPARTTTDRNTLLYGWVRCTSGERAGVAVTANQLGDLESQMLPCPRCGSACKLDFEPSSETKSQAVRWTGTRWATNVP